MLPVRVFVEDPKYPDRVTHTTGYAEVHRGLILALDSMGIETGFPRCESEIGASRMLPDDVKARLLAINRRPFQDDEDAVHLQAATPDSFVPRAGRFNVGLTMTERESLAYYQERFDWVGLCNAMDLVLTPTEWNRAVFERHGIRNLVVAPLGVDAEFFTPRPYRFLTSITGYGRRGSRSNWADILEAFRAEFHGVVDAELTVFTKEPRRRFEYSGVRETIALVADDVGDLLQTISSRREPAVEIVDAGGLAQDQVRAVYRAHDCYVSYSREGWGLTTLEAMACGLDVIACDYGAPLAYLTGSPARLFAAGRVSADGLKFEGGDVSALRAHMRSAYEEKRRTTKWASNFGWRASATLIEAALRPRHAQWKRGALPRAGGHKPPG